MNGYYLACQKCPGIHIIAYLYELPFFAWLSRTKIMYLMF